MTKYFSTLQCPIIQCHVKKTFGSKQEDLSVNYKVQLASQNCVLYYEKLAYFIQLKLAFNFLKVNQFIFNDFR